MSDWLEAVGGFLGGLAAGIMRFAADHIYWAILIILFIEEAGVPLPVPGDTIILYAGYRVSLGHANAFLAALCVVVATLAGSSVLYWIARLGGHALVFKYGRYVHLDEKRLMRMERWLQEHQRSAIFFGRMLPGLRTATSVVAGIFEVDYRVFLIYTGLSSVVWAAVYLVAGIILGREYDQLAPYIIYILSQPLVQVGLVIGAIALVFWLMLRRRRRSRQAAADGVLDGAVERHEQARTER